MSDRPITCFTYALALLLAPLVTLGQNQLTIDVQVTPPYSANYADYFQSGNQVFIRINNLAPGAPTYQVYLTGYIRTVDGSVSVGIPPQTRWNAPPLTVVPGVNQLTGSDLQPFLASGGSEIEFIGTNETDIRTGLLPEGEYQICLQAFDYNTDQPLSMENPSAGCSNIFNVTFPPPPIPTSPLCDSDVPAMTPQTVVFMWNLPLGPPPGASLVYHFKLVHLGDDDLGAIDVVSALEASTFPWHEAELTTPMLLYDQTKPPLEQGQRYGWRVQVEDVVGGTVYQNDGFSEPCIFTYSANVPLIAESPSLFKIAYPANGDTLPWDFMPIIQRFDPYQEIQHFNSALTITEDGATFDDQARDLHWNSGPQRSQQFLVRDGLNNDNINITLEESQHVNIYKSPAEPPGKRFMHGHTYSSVATLRTALTYDGPYTNSEQVFNAFRSGMATPRPRAPGYNERLPKNGGDASLSGFAGVAIRFKTSEPPSRLTPPFPIWYIPNGGTPTQISGAVNERWRLEISKDETFTTTVEVKTGRIGVGVEMPGLNATCTEQCLIDSLYKEVAYTFTPTSEGTYFWRVSWLSDAEDPLSKPYLTGPVWKFTIGEGAAEVEQEEEIVRETDLNCLAGCAMSPIPAAERMPVKTAQIGDTIDVGLFEMRLTQIAWTGVEATGQGTIEVPFMHAPLRVRFERIKINQRKRLFEGEVKGVHDNADVIPPAWIQGGAMAAGFNAQDAEAIENYVNAQGRLVSQMTMSNPMGLPIAIDSPNPEIPMSVSVLAMRFVDTLATMNAVMNYRIPEEGLNLGLGNMDMPFTPSGPGCVTAQATLYLVNDVKVKITEDQDSLLFKGTKFETHDFQAVRDSGTFVAWDCHGFRAITIDGEYRFSRETLVEDLPDGTDGPTKIAAAFKGRAGRQGYLLRADFNKPFHVKGGSGWGFDVQEAWVDHASYTNPSQIRFPKDYGQITGLAQAGQPIPTSWHGLYIERAMMRLPEEIEAFDQPGRVTAVVDHLIVDGNGLSSELKVANLLGPDEGNLDGWGFSMDTLQLDIIANSFSQAGFKGRIHLPISDTLLTYSAMLQQNIVDNDWRAEFLVRPENDLNVPMFFAEMKLEETSYIQAVVGDEQEGTYAKAELNGLITINKDNIPKIGRMSFRDIRFNHLTFETRDPYTNAGQSGVFSLASPQKWIGGTSAPTDPANGEEGEHKAGGFPITITKVDMERRNLDGKKMVGLCFDISLNLTGDENVFTATTRIAVLGELNTEAMHKWGHNEVELDSIGVYGDVGVVKVSGGLRFYYGDDIYGDGIKGLLRAEFLKGKLKVQAAMQFGSKGTLRYWYADAMAAMENGIDVAPGFTVYGFGGGAWRHMRRTSDPPSAKDITNQIISEQDEENQPVGLSLSGITFVPDAAINYGFQATMVFGNPGGGTAYNADVTIGADIGTTGGVSRMFLNGHAYFLGTRNERTYTPVHGEADIYFDFPNDVFSAQFDVYVSIGSGMVTGLGAGDHAGRVALYISSDTWHLHVGTPDTPIGLDFVGLFDMESYLMIGEDLPAAMPPPSEVTAKYGITAQNLTSQRQDFSNGLNGFAMGGRMSAGDTLKFGLLRFRFAAGMGFDLSLLDYGDTECSGSGEQIGVNGWYAEGQLYGYFTGAVSLYVDLWFTEGEFEIFEVGAALLVQGGLPEPYYAMGSVSGHYSILGGAISGNASFPFELGEQCDPSEGTLGGLEPIRDLKPSHGALAVSCGVNPEATFDVSMNEVFEMYEIKDDGGRVRHVYRLTIEKFEVKQGSTALTGTQHLSTSKDQVTLIPNAFLEANMAHTVTIRVKAEEMNTSTMEWAQARKDGSPVFWEKTHSFTTGPEPDRIDPSWVNYSYPFHDQRRLLQDECRNGFIEVKSDMTQMDLFDTTPAENKVRTFRVVFTPVSGGATLESPVQLSGGAPMHIFFEIPVLSNSKVYRVQLIAKDSTVNTHTGPQAVLAGVALDHSAMMFSTGSYTNRSLMDGRIQLRQRTLAGYSLRSNEKMLYNFYFGTSQHNTLASKVAAMQHVVTVRDPVTPITAVNEHLYSYYTGERFDRVDVRGFAYGPGAGLKIPPLVDISEARTDAWTTSWAQPIIYDFYSAARNHPYTPTLLKLNRGLIYTEAGVMQGPDTIGIPPTNTIWFDVNTPTAALLTASDRRSNSLYGNNAIVADGLPLAVAVGESSGPVSDVRLKTSTAIYVRQDYLRMATITGDISSRYGSPYGQEHFIGEPVDEYMRDYLESTYKVMYKGTYAADLEFRPPFTCVENIILRTTGEGEGPAPNPVGSRVQYVHTTGPSAPRRITFGTEATPPTKSTSTTSPTR
ncbi:MAG TPA: hypothetical protein PLB89_02385 [Flavobacteriales bacterium]|nr:hypothetical protein [Flavobacteriales bacterium]